MSDPAPTRLDPARTRLDAPAARPGVRPARTIFNLPAALAEHWRVVEPLPAGGAEAELLVVERLDGSEQAVAKLYRPGVQPPFAALDRLTGAITEHVVRVLERGDSDGIAYELMEYCRAGSLGDHLATAPGDLRFARRVLEELAPALKHLHATGLIHRDLKPQNILVRGVEPLDLVLTDFGIASISEGTMHFTSTSRTVRYAPPEAMTGVLSFKADYWSLGMILLELLAGRHPFEGLSEAVTNHQLLTRSVDVGAVADASWRNLVRGLLLRDPARRWGDAEIRRWLDGDTTLALTALPPDEVASTVRLYEIDDERCGTVEALALALVRHWPTGVKDLARGFVTTWLRDELHDQNLVRYVLDLMDAPLSPDQRLLRFALRAAPGLPPVWKGVSLDADSFEAIVRRAVAGNDAEANFLFDLEACDALANFLERPHPQSARLAALRACWRERVAAFREAEQVLIDAERTARAEVAADSAFANFDDLVYGTTVGTPGGVSPPPHALLLTPEIAPGLVPAARDRLTGLMAQLGDDAPWFQALGTPTAASIESLAALEVIGPRARAFAEARRAQRALALQRVRLEAQALRDEVKRMMTTTHDLVAEGGGAAGSREALRALHQDFIQLHGRAFATTDDASAFEPVRRVLRRAGLPFRRLAVNLDRLDYLDRVRSVALQQGRALLIAVALLPLLLGLKVFLIAVAPLIAIVLLWYVWMRFHAVGEIKRCADRLPRASTED